MGSLGIAIDGGRYVRVDSSIGGRYQTVRLRTIRAGQDTARLDFCKFRKNGPQIRRTILLTGLSREGDSTSELRLRTERLSFAVWEVNIRRPDGRSENHRVRTGLGLWPLIIPIVLLLVIGGWITIRAVYGDSVEQVSSPAPVPEVQIEPLKDAGETETVKTTTSAESGAVKLPSQTNIYFRPESAELSSRAVNELLNLAETMVDDISIEIGGHCANYGTERGRWALSELRADVVAEFLSDRIPSSVTVVIKGYGGLYPVHNEPENQDLNRRVEIKMIGDGG